MRNAVVLILASVAVLLVSAVASPAPPHRRQPDGKVVLQRRGNLLPSTGRQ